MAREHPIKKSTPTTAKEVIAWIKAHPLFKWGGMCADLGLNRGNFAKLMGSDSPVIKPATLLKIVSIIKKYGYEKEKSGCKAHQKLS